MTLMDRWAIVGTLATIVGVPLTIAGVWIGVSAFTRQFGYKEAKFRLLGADFASDHIAESLKKKGLFGIGLIGLDDLDDMIRLNPAIIVQPQNGDPLEALRVEVTPSPDPLDFVIDVDLSEGPRTEADSKMTPWALEKVMAKDYPIVERPVAGQKLRVPIADLLVRHMAQFQVKEPERRHRPHYGKFVVQVYAKLAGSPVWSGEAEGKAIVFSYFWRPTGFPEERCEDFARKFNQPPTPVQ